MIAQRETLVDAAKAAGIDVPPDLHDYDKSKFPFWHLFCITQIDRPQPSAYSHYKNATIVADIDPERIKDLSFRDITDFLE